MNKIVKLAYCKAIGWMHIDLDQDYKNSIFIAGTGRSGTTWLMDLVNYKNEYRTMFEPFHSYKVKAFKHYIATANICGRIARTKKYIILCINFLPAE